VREEKEEKWNGRERRKGVRMGEQGEYGGARKGRGGRKGGRKGSRLEYGSGRGGGEPACGRVVQGGSGGLITGGARRGMKL